MMLKYLTLSLLLFTSLASAQSFVYITDQIDIPMRSEKALGDNIVRLLPSGTKLAILQATKDGWTQVKFESSTGWVISRYLSNSPSAKMRLSKLKQTYNANKLLITKLVKRKTELESEVQVLKTSNGELTAESNKSKAEKKHVEEIYADALELEHVNEKLITQNLQLETEIQLLKNSSGGIEESSARNWFIAGGFVLFFGILIGFIFTNLANRRRH